MQVKELMTRDPKCGREESKLEDIARIMDDEDCGEVPICRDARPVGAITDRDITIRSVARGQNPLGMRAADVMTTPCVTVREDSSLEECVETMQEHRIRRVPVVDSEGVCTGIISQADIAEHGPRQLTAELVQAVSAAG